jgi:hypothetical protein
VLKTASATTGALSRVHLRLRQAGPYSHVDGDLRRGIAAKYVARRRGQTSAKRLPESRISRRLDVSNGWLLSLPFDQSEHVSGS